MSHSRKNRSEGPYEGEEAGEHDGFAAVALKEQLRVDKMIVVKKERIFAFEDFRPYVFAECIPHAVAGDGSQERNDREDLNIKNSLRREKPGGEKKRVAGKNGAQKKTGLGKDNDGDAEQADGFDEDPQVHNLVLF